jgi:alkylation response protein AidB-like acyl-CoA dehydrogenase
MTTYKAPLRDMQFVMQDLLNFEKHYQSLPACDEVNQELIDAILGEASKFSEEVVAPLNAVGDETGCEMLENGEVRTPPGFKEAYQQYVDGGWPSLDQPSRYGGQDLPLSIGMTIREMAGTANWSWAMYSGLSHGAMETIDAHGSEEQKALFMGPLVSGRWTGTMCLTEAHCGTDLGLLKTKADRRRHLPHYRFETVRLVGRTRSRRKHRSHRAGTLAGLATGYERYINVHRAQVCSQRRRLDWRA